MKKYFLFGFIGLSLISCDLLQNDSGTPINENIWVNAYLASSEHNPQTEFINSGIITTDDIDWDAITHLTYFALEIGSDGTPAQTFDPAERKPFSSDHLKSIVNAAHAPEHNKKILFSVGSASNNIGFSSAIVDTNRQRFVQTIAMMINKYKFDGVNLILIPVRKADYNNYSEFVHYLYSTFDTLHTAKNQRPILTAATLKADSLITLHADLQSYFDQINIMTYSMARPFEGWQAWHNSALYNKTQRLSSNNTLLPSVSEAIDNAIENGINREKLGITINFYGSLWETVNFNERWVSWPNQDMSIYHSITYATINDEMDLSKAIWDDEAKVPYLNNANPKSFVSFENKESVSEKVTYAMQKRIGGIMIWDLGAGFLPNKKNGAKDPLLQSVKSTKEAAILNN